MKKLLTLIMPALVLTAGAPLAQECEYGYSFLSVAVKYVRSGPGRQDKLVSLGHGLDEAEAKKAALADFCPDARAEQCEIWLGSTASGSPKAQCQAVYQYDVEGRKYGNYQWGANEADAKKRAMAYCQEHGVVCRITEVMCTECLADKGYRYGAFSRDNGIAYDEISPGVSYAQLGIDPPPPGWKPNIYGWATNFQSSWAAIKAALSECEQEGGTKCEILSTFSTVPNATAGGWAWEQSGQDKADPNSSRCLAYVDDGDGRPAHPELKVGSSRQEAIDKSMQYCGGGGQCAVKLALCADDEADEVLAAD